MLAHGHEVKTDCGQKRERLLVLVIGGDRFQIFSFKDLAAIETLHIVHAVTSYEDLRPGMLTNGLHKSKMRFILATPVWLSSEFLRSMHGVTIQEDVLSRSPDAALAPHGAVA